MASPHHLPTPRRGTETDHLLSISPGVAGMSDMENYGQPETYFQPIQDHDTPNSEYAAIMTDSPSTTERQNPATTQIPFHGAQQIIFPDAAPQALSLQTSSPVSCCLTPTHDTLVPVSQSLSTVVTSCTLTTENYSSEPFDLGTRSLSPSPPCPLVLHTKSVPKTSVPPLFLSTLDVDPSSHSAETQVQLCLTTELASPLCSDQLPKDSEVTSLLSNHQRTNSELPGESSEASKQASSVDCYQRDEDVLGKDPNQDKMNGDVLKPSDISDLPSLIDSSIKAKTPGEENVISSSGQQSLHHCTTLYGLSSTEASFEKSSVSEKILLIPDDSITQNQAEDNQSEPFDLKTHMPPLIPETKSGGSADYMPVLYLQVTKTVQEETQRDTDTNQSQQPAALSTLTRNKVRFSSSETSEHTAHVLGSDENDSLQHLHEEQGQGVLGKQQENLPVVGDGTMAEQKKSKKALSAKTKTHQPISPDAVAVHKTHWTSQAVSKANYHNYYGSVCPDYGNTGPPFSDKYSLHYSRAHHAWMDLKGHRSQTGVEAQFYDKNPQKVQGNLKQLEQSSSEHVDSSNQMTSRQKRSKERSVMVGQAKMSPSWSDNYIKYYNCGGWNPQGHYSSDYYQGYYYPYNYGYQAEVSKGHSQQYDTKFDNYDDWWRYDPRYDLTFDHDHFTQYQQSYWDQGDRQSSHSGYSTQSMSSTNSHHSRFSWHSEQSWGYPSQGYPSYDGRVQSLAHSEKHCQLPKETSNEDFNATCSSESPSITEQFSCPHCCARFGPGGQLIQVLPNLPSEGKPALVQIHNTEVMLNSCWDQIQLQTYPGPLIKERTHKSEVLEFVRKKYQECVQSETLADKEASCLIWELMELVCKQNGKLVGTDVSHLLLRNQRQPPLSKKASDLIDFTNEALSGALGNQTSDAESVTEDAFWTTPKDTERDVQCFRELLILGRKKDALQTAISKGLWGHAFMLASKMDSRAYSQVMSKFIDNLPESDLLQTFYQLMSGKIPSSSAHCGDKEWGDWRTHLAMVLSNHTRFKHLHKKVISRMGDALASKGFSDAASFCYMVDQLDVDTQSNKSGLFLFGASSSFPPPKYVTNEVIQRTELFEYALSLGSDSVDLPNVQIFKFIYACRLAEVGLCAQAFQYCEVISKALLTSASEQYLTLISQLIELSSKIRHFDQHMKDIPELDLSLEPEWMVNLQELRCQIIEKLTSPSSKQVDTDLLPTLKTTIAEYDPSFKVSLLAAEMPYEKSGLPEMHLVPPAPQDILKNILPKSGEVLGPGYLKSDNKAVPLSTSPISQKSTYPTKPSAGEQVPALEIQATSEPHFQNLSTTAGQLPARIVLTEGADQFLEDQSRKAKESTPTLGAPLPAPPTLHQFCPVQSQYTDIQLQPISTISAKSTQFALEPSTLPPTATPSSVSLATESESVPHLVAHSKESYTLPSAMLPSSTTVSVSQLTDPNIGAHELPSTTLPSSITLATECESVPQLADPPIKPHTLPSTVLLAKEPESVPDLVAHSIEPHTFSSTVLPSTMSLAKESQSVPQLVTPYIEPHILSSTALPSSVNLATDSQPGHQLIAPNTVPHTLPSTTVWSAMSLATESEYVPQLTAPIPFPKTYDQIKGHPDQKQQSVTHPNATTVSPQIAPASNPWATEQNLYLDKEQPVSSISTMQAPHTSYPSISNRNSLPTYTKEPQTVPLLTVPLPTSHTLPPSSSDYSATQGQHVALTEFRPPQSLGLTEDPVLEQKPPPLPHSVNPYAMGEKMVSSKHILSKPLIPRLFVPQSPLPDHQPKGQESGGGWFSWLFGKKKETDLPADTGKSLVWDDHLERWVDPTDKKYSGYFDEPQTKGLNSAKPVLRPGPKRGYMPPLNPVLMSNNPGTQHYASAGRSSTAAQMVKPPNTHLTDPATGHTRWTHPVPYSQTPQNLSQNQKSPTAENVPLYNPSHFCQDLL